MPKRMAPTEFGSIDARRLLGIRSSLTEDEIARRAFEIFEARGAQHGNDLEDWLQAERELRGGVASRAS